MKGVIFRSFLDFAEQEFGLEFVDSMIESVATNSAGAYANTGTYPAEELFGMVGFLVEAQNMDQSTLLRSFGEYTFGVLANRYADMIAGFSDTLDCVMNLDQTIHRNVLKLYPDAELPQMDAQHAAAPDALVLEYRSTRPLMHMAHGLLLGCVKHYGDSVEIQLRDKSGGVGNHAQFVLTRQ